MCEIRPATLHDADAIAHVHVASWRTAYCGLIADETLDALSEQGRAALWRDLLSDDSGRRFVFVAERTGEIVGFCDTHILQSPQADGIDSEITAIYLLEEHRGRGIGRRLLNRAVESLQQAGCRGLQLEVLADNPYRAFYDRLGGTATRTGVYRTNSQELGTVIYTWQSLDDVAID